LPGIMTKKVRPRRGTSAVQNPIEAACVDRRIERTSFSRDHPVPF
jgi:hypothetical protein